MTEDAFELMQRRGAANRRRNAPHLMLLTLISCFGPVEAVATQSAATLCTAVLASLAKHKMICVGLLVLIAIRAIVRLTRLLLHGPRATRRPIHPDLVTFST
jgi:hypothetical protein